MVENSNGEKVLVCSNGDVRDENRKLAFKMLIRELKKLNNEDVLSIFARYKLCEIEQGDSLSLGINFPDDTERYQWFYDENGDKILKHIVPVNE